MSFFFGCQTQQTEFLKKRDHLNSGNWAWLNPSARFFSPFIRLFFKPRFVVPIPFLFFLVFCFAFCLVVVWLVPSEPKLVAFGMKRRFLDSNTLEEQQEQKKKKC